MLFALSKARQPANLLKKTAILGIQKRFLLENLKKDIKTGGTDLFCRSVFLSPWKKGRIQVQSVQRQIWFECTYCTNCAVVQCLAQKRTSVDSPLRRAGRIYPFLKEGGTTVN